MSTKTLRPLKKGDPCYVRIQRRGEPVLAVYDEFLNHKNHGVYIGHDYFIAISMMRHMCDHECIFVAKPVGEKTP